MFFLTQPAAFWIALAFLPPLAWVRRRRWPGSRLSESLRLLSLLLLAAALGGPGYRRASIDPPVRIVCIDASGSVLALYGGTAATAFPRIADQILAATGEAPDSVAAWIAFDATGPVTLSPPNGARREQRVRDLADRLTNACTRPGGTPLAAALDAAASRIPPDRDAEIILLTDGRAFEADPDAPAARLGATHARVRILPLPAPPPDLRIAGIDVPTEAAEGETIPVRIRIASSVATSAHLRITSAGTVVAEADVQASSASEAILAATIPPLARAPGVYEARITAPIAANAVAENDAWPFVIRPRGLTSVVIPAGRSELLKHTLEQDPSLAVSTAPDAPAEVVLLDNADLQSLPPGYLDRLAERVRAGARGLVLLGGPHAYGLGRYSGSAIDPLLPLDSIPAEPLALALLLDLSGSMNEPEADGRAKLAWSVDAVRSLIPSLRPADLLLVAGFAAQPRTLVPLQNTPTPEAVDRRLRAATAGGPTRLDSAIRSCRSSLAAATAARRHLVILTDGFAEDTPEALEKAAADLAASRITLTLVAIGPKVDEARLARLASAGGEQIRLHGYADLTNALEEDLTSTRELTGAGPAAPRGVEAPGPISSTAPWPRIMTWNRTSLRPRAELLIAGPDDVPLVARGQAGLGRVIAATWSLDPEWTPGLPEWSGLQAFLREAIAGVAPLRPGAGLELHIRTTIAGTEVTVRRPRDASLTEGWNLEGELRFGDGSAVKYSAEMTGPDETRFRIAEPFGGMSMLRIRRAGAPEVLADLPLTRPYAPEWSAFGADAVALEALASAGSGATPRIPTEHDLRPTLALAALLALVLSLWLPSPRRGEGTGVRG